MFYYISQKTERSAAFMPQEVTDQRVIAVYFDKERRVVRLANYGLKDGKIFDFISQTTPTGGQRTQFTSAAFSRQPSTRSASERIWQERKRARG